MPGRRPPGRLQLACWAGALAWGLSVLPGWCGAACMRRRRLCCLGAGRAARCYAELQAAFTNVLGRGSEHLQVCHTHVPPLLGGFTTACYSTCSAVIVQLLTSMPVAALYTARDLVTQHYDTSIADRTVLIAFWL